MTTLTLDENIKLSKTNFSNMLELYDFIVENQIITEVWVLDEQDLSVKSKALLERSRKLSKVINI